MERYIDADRFIERLNASPAFPNMGTDGYFLLGVVENLLKSFPTADVAPKSEVAREIFDELLEKLELISIVAQPTDGFTQGVIKTFNKTSALISELKKKYTEGEGK